MKRQRKLIDRENEKTEKEEIGKRKCRKRLNKSSKVTKSIKVKECEAKYGKGK
jgi:hypothetical protein